MPSVKLIAGLAAALLPTLASSGPLMTPVKRDLKFPFGSEKIRGVNLGGWFVLEPWITPSIFDEWADNMEVVDEYTFCKVLGYDAALSRLQAHWNSWITQADFEQMASYGINFVRIPIGWWSVAPIPGIPYVQGAYEVLGSALDWANAAGIKVMIDLHGAPGSQNGFDNSGKKGPIYWLGGNSIAQTHAALNQIRDDHASNPAVAAIELVNEPMGSALDMSTVQQFYYDGWGDLQDSDVAVTYHDAFEPTTYWNSFGTGLDNLLQDTHHYEVFDSGSLGMTTPEHVSSACGYGESMTAANKWITCGEWTGAMTDCAQWLNGLGVGSRYDGTYPGSYYIGSCDGLATGTVDALPPATKTAIRQFIEAQMDAYELNAGWIFWTWKTESAPEWHFQNLTMAGVMPQPLTAREFPGQCG